MAFHQIGSQWWFEYHCWESPQSADAELWYRSHQQVVILSLADCDVARSPELLDETADARAEAGMPLLYTVRFSDGFEHGVFEDELVPSPEDFERTPPPVRPPQHGEVHIQSNQKTRTSR